MTWCRFSRRVPLAHLNGDCVVNDGDLAILQAHRLECNALDCNNVKQEPNALHPLDRGCIPW